MANRSRRSNPSAVASRVGFAAVLLLVSPGCKRTADAPLPQQALFPDVVHAPPTPTVGEIVRAELMTATEPDNTRNTARKLPHNVVVTGTLRATDDTPKGKGRYRKLDDDWFELAASDDDLQVARIELRDAPKCARLDVFGRSNRPLKRAPWHRGIRPVVPSLRLDRGPYWIRVRCLVRRVPRKGRAVQTGGSYRLAISARPRRMDEEREPNDKFGPETVVVAHGQTVQATLAPRGDVDVFRLDLSAAEPGAAQMLSINGAPGVSLEVALLADGQNDPILLRKPRRGAGVLVPNLDVRRTGGAVTLRIRALGGQAPDAPYAATVRPLMPNGCTDQQVCPEKVPVEREPNDTRSAAMGVKAGSLISGVLDGRGDEDWFAIDGQPGDVMQVFLRAPEGLAVQLAASEGAAPFVTIQGKPDGARVTLPGWKTSKRRVWVRVSGVDQAADATALYFLRVRFESLPHFEDSQRDGQALHDDGDGTLTRHGVLLPTGDTDTFTLDWRTRGGPSNAVFACKGDGAPGLLCTLTDEAGKQIAQLVAPDDDNQIRMPLQLAPGLYHVTITSRQPRPSIHPFDVTIEDGGLLPAPLPTSVTGAHGINSEMLGGPESVAPSGQ
ncbi:MAG: hypothetical protein KC502_12910 [Myxococcales bacterium]|nr:hypothetical protein [Myxococcales bacterium]